MWFIKRRKKKIFKRKRFKKKIFVLMGILHKKCLYFCTPVHYIRTNIIKRLLCTYKKYLVDRFCQYNYIYNPYQDIKQNYRLFSIILSQKSQNIKCTFMSKDTINTFTTGTVLRYFGIYPKGLRRDIKSTKMFLNFLKVLLCDKYKHNFQKSTLLFNVVGFNYSMLVLKKNIKDLILNVDCIDGEIFSIFKIKIPFTKRKNKRLKSIKKRLKKNILARFLKTIKFKLF